MFGDSLRRRLFRAAGYGIGDAQLQRPQLQRHDARVACPLAAGMGNAAQAAPNQHIPAGADAGTGVHIAQHQHGPIHFQVLTGGTVPRCTCKLRSGFLRLSAS